jgi:hypothetical protein
VPTEQGADARALGGDPALECSAERLLVSVVAARWIEHVGQRIGPPLVHSGGRDRAASALKEAARRAVRNSGMGHVERRLEASTSPSRGIAQTAVAAHADLIAAIEHFIRGYNERAQPFLWTKTPEQDPRLGHQRSTHFRNAALVLGDGSGFCGTPSCEV